MKQKKVFIIVFLSLTVMLMVLPLLVSFNQFLTDLVESFSLYIWVQEKIVPMEVKMTAVLVKPLGFKFEAHREGLTVNGLYAGITWNCLGWQSLLLFLITLPFGLSGGNFTLISKTEAVLIGLLGTFLVNLARMVFTVVLLAVSQPLFAIVFHDYLAAIVTIIWLLIFWWFSYSFVLEEKSR